MANYFDRFDAPKEQPKNFFDQFDAVKPEEKSGFWRQVPDVPVGVAKGAVSGIGMLVNLFGPDTEAAKAISGAQDYLNSLLSATARNDQQEIARIMKEAEGKGVGEEVKAAVRAFATAPVDFLSQALGTAAPAIAAGLGASVLGAGAVGATAVGALTGAGMGAGTVKGTIYEQTKQALLDAGMDPKQAEARAVLAQEYGGKNLDMILSGAALGGLAATTGVEKALIGPLSRRILGQAAAKEAGKEVAEQAAKGIVRRTATGAAAEAAPEFAQAAQEQFAANLAAQREGLERDLLAGVAGAGTLEALAGAGLGGGIGAVTGRGGKAEAKPGEEPVVEKRQEPKVTMYQTTDFDGKPIQVQVTEDPNTGDVIAVGPDGEEVDLTPLMRGTTTIPDVLAKIYGGEETTPVTPEPEAPVTKEPPAIPETPVTEEPGVTPVTPEPQPEPTPVAPEPKMPVIPEAPAVPPVEPEAIAKPTIEATPAEQGLPEKKLTKQKLYHGTSSDFADFDFDFNGGMTFFGDQKDIATRYAYGAGGQRQSLSNKQKYIINNQNGVAYELSDNNTWSPVGVVDDTAEVINQQTLKPLDKEYPPLTQEQAEKLVDPWSGEGVAIPKTARIIETDVSDLNILDITTPQGRDVIAKLQPKTAKGQGIIEAARFDQKQPDNSTTQLNANFWGTTKYGNAHKDALRTDIVEPLKALGYDGIFFNDDQHKTYALFDRPKVIEQVATQAKKEATPTEPETLAISPEEQKKAALQGLSLALNKPIPAFRAQHPSGRVTRVAPKPLTASQKNLLLGLYSDAVDLGLPPSLLSKITAAGSTQMSNSGAMAAQDGWLMIGKMWSKSTSAEKLTTLIHELGHSVDYKGPQNYYSISKSSEWTKANKELKQWYDREPNITNPLSYPFSPTFKRSVPSPETESFPQAFALYFVAPVQLQQNAPAAYSAIQSIVERIQNESKGTRAAGAKPTTAPRVQVREARPGEGAEIQPDVSQVSPAVRRAERLKDRAGPVTRVSASVIEAGKAAVETTNKLGRGVQVEPDFTEKVKRFVTGDPGAEKITPEAAKVALKRFLDKIETSVFSSDAAMNSAIRRIIRDTSMTDEQKLGVLLHISSSQTVHADALANAFMRYGALSYDEQLHKYQAVDDKNNLVAMVTKVAEIAKQYGMTQQEAERVAHTAFEAKRLRGLQEANQRLETEIDNLRKEAREGPTQTSRDLARKEIRRKTKDFKYIHMTDEQIDEALSLFDTIPELNDVVDIWNGIRKNAVQRLVEDGLWSQEEADILLANIDYVPFYREDQLEKGKGPKEFLRNLQVQAKEKKLKGSDKPVADIFDNMARWTQYAIKRSVLNRQAVALVDTALEIGLAEKVKSKREGENTVRVWRDGNEEYYKMADPLFMDAFKGLEGVSIPTLKLAAKFANMLRQSVVLYPLFSIAQVPQDAFAAMFSSGLKTRYALTIPARAVKEFLKTLFKRSQTHKELERFGAVGIRDFTSEIAREDAQVMAGLKARPGVFNKVKGILEHISMASDNAVRQAVYEASIAQGDSKAAALEKAFQLINFRNRGSSKGIAMAGQVIPFFNAYLAAQHVAIKVVSGRGISPQDRAEALKTLAYTTTAIMALSLIYAMMIADDDDYQKKPSVMRDRLFMIPGTGLSIPIRQDIFSIPKILTEHLYLLMTDNGSEDGRKFRDSMKAALFNSVASPTPVPQAIKPVAEVIMNYNFFQGRPLIGTYQKTLETERQFTDSTSELAKLLGSTGMISPIAADHLIRGMFGSVGGLTIYMTNPLLDSFGESSRPEMSWREALSSLPGTSGFVSKPNETALKNDFYVLRDEVAKVANTLNDMKARSPQDIEEYLKDEDNLNKLGLKPAVDRITNNMSTIRRAISRINNMPDSQMSPEEKAKQIDELRKTEQEMLESLDIKSLRKMAGL